MSPCLSVHEAFFLEFPEFSRYDISDGMTYSRTKLIYRTWHDEKWSRQPNTFVMFYI